MNFGSASAASPLPVLRSREARVLWHVVLVAITVLMGTTLACIAPFPALALVASRTLSRWEAALSVLAALLANQAIGVLLLGFPRSATTALWAAAFAVAVVAALVAARSVCHVLLALVAAFVAYQAILAAFSLALERSLANFTTAIVAEVAFVNAFGVVVLGLAYAGLGAVERARASSVARVLAP